MHDFDVPVSTPNAPPGFENLGIKSSSNHTALQLIDPQMSRRQPSAVNFDPKWQLQAGGASLETGLQTLQDQLQSPEKPQNMHDFDNPESTPNAPPGFENLAIKSSSYHTALQRIDPRMSWRQPSAVHFDPKWHLQAGGASLETGLETQREVRIFEALYPRSSSIPESPAKPVEIQEPYDDKNNPQIPLEPLEKGKLLDEPLVYVHTPVHTNWSWKNEVDVQAAASAACAALSEYYMIDKEQVIQILRDPSQIQSLISSKWPFATTTNAIPDLSSSMNFNRVPRRADQIDQAQVMNGVVGRPEHWINAPHKSGEMSFVAGGNEGHESSSGQSYISAGDRFHRTEGSEDMHILPGAVGDRQLFADYKNCGRIGLGQLPRPTKQSEGPPGFCSSKPIGSGITPPSFSTKSPSQVGAQTGEVEAAAPRIKRRKRCYYFGTARGCRNGDNCGFIH